MACIFDYYSIQALPGAAVEAGGPGGAEEHVVQSAEHVHSQ